MVNEQDNAFKRQKRKRETEKTPSEAGSEVRRFPRRDNEVREAARQARPPGISLSENPALPTCTLEFRASAFSTVEFSWSMPSM